MAAVYGREIDGKVLTIRPSGWTYDNLFVLVDDETGTLWYPDRKGLKGIQGKLLGKRLPELKSKDTTWKRWARKHPDSSLLK
jgi:hypothetical protein